VKGTPEEALASPSAARYLCATESESDFGDFQCLHDHVGSGICAFHPEDEGFMVLTGVRSNLPLTRTVERGRPREHEHALLLTLPLC
jgi:hypothetical protein